MDLKRRRLLQTVVGASTVALAGCSGDGVLGGDGDGDGSDDDGGSDGGGSDGGGSDDDGDGSDGGGQVSAPSGTFRQFEFEAGERYEYEVFMESEGEGTFTWEVTDVTGDQITVHVVYDVGETYYESTTTGDRNTIQGQVMSSPAGSFLAVAIFSPTYSYYQRDDLQVGNKWEASSPEGSSSIEIVSKDVYAGVECFASEVRSDGELVHEACVNPELGLAVYSAFYNDDGSLELEMELVDYSR